MLTDFQENIGALSDVARRTIDALVAEYGARRVIDSIREAVIYEKRSIGYIRCVLSAWKRDGRSHRDEAKSKYPGLPDNCDDSKLPDAADLV